MPRGFADHSVRRRSAADRAVWPGAAFVVEALILLVFLAGCLAVFMQLFGDADQMGRQNVRLERAVELASNRAECFAADPLGGAGAAEEAEGDLVVTCDVEPEELGAGVLYRAEIDVRDGDEVVYEVATARYVAGAGAADAQGAQGGGANG